MFAHGCTTVPYTNRSQIMLMSESDDLQLGAAAYQEVLHKEKIVHDPTITAPVQRVGQRIAAAADKKDYQWEFSVIDDPKQANAFCLPGGKVAVTPASSRSRTTTLVWPRSSVTRSRTPWRGTAPSA